MDWSRISNLLEEAAAIHRPGGAGNLAALDMQRRQRQALDEDRARRMDQEDAAGQMLRLQGQGAMTQQPSGLDPASGIAWNQERPAIDKQYMQDLMVRASGGPAAYFKNQMAAQAEANKTQFAAPGSGVFRGGEMVDQVPFAPDKPSAMFKDAMALAGGDETKALEFVNKWRQPPSTNITMAGDKAVTGVDSGRYKSTAAQLDKLDAMAPGLERMMGAIASGAQTGFGQNWILPAKQAFQEFTGQELKGTSEQEVLKSIQNYLGPQMRTPGSGSSSDTDVKMFVDSIPTLSKTEDGNRALATYYGKLRDRTAQILQIQQDLLRKYEYIPVTEERAAIKALGPLFSDEDKSVLKGTAQKAATKPSNVIRTYNPATGQLE